MRETVATIIALRSRIFVFPKSEVELDVEAYAVWVSRTRICLSKLLTTSGSEVIPMVTRLSVAVNSKVTITSPIIRDSDHQHGIWYSDIFNDICLTSQSHMRSL